MPTVPTPKTPAELDREIAEALASRPAPVASSAPKLTAKRAKDFRDSHTYEVRDDFGTLVALMFRDPESRDWYEEELPGMPQTHYIDRWCGGTQAEALVSITRHVARRRGL